MPQTKCKCGVYTDNGLFCVNCSKGASLDMLYHHPDDDDDTLEEYEGLTIVDDFAPYDYDEDDDD